MTASQSRPYSSQPNPAPYHQHLNGGGQHIHNGQLRAGPTLFPNHYLPTPPQLPPGMPSLPPFPTGYHQNPAFMQSMLPRQAMEPIDLTQEPSTAEIDHLPPNAPLFLGQITVTTLVMYPVPYLTSQRAQTSALSAGEEWVPVKLRQEANAARPDGVAVCVPPRQKSGASAISDAFGCLEKRAAIVLGPWIKNGTVRLDARIKRALTPNVSNTAFFVILSVTASFLAYRDADCYPDIHTQRQYAPRFGNPLAEWHPTGPSHLSFRPQSPG